FLYRRDGGRRSARWDLTLEQHQILRWTKYGLLAVLLILVVLTQSPVFEDIDPFKSLFNLDFSFGVPLVLLIIVLVVSILIGFPFCKYACPLGAFLGIFQPLSIFKVKIGDGCTNCRACCDMFCDYHAIEPGLDRPTVNQRECVRCGECVARCPTGAIQFTSKR
ncbi:MAG: 4Fe-4S binding protein, partial [Dehalococcoidia bacterium]|nr:4Fe-4S binding protein [Dehalococcoidia bacterium]